MPPKCKYTKEEIVSRALDVIRAGGVEALTARSLAEALGASSKPIFGLFENMSQVTAAAMEAAQGLYSECLQRSMARLDIPAYKASGLGYIQFAMEEKELFRWLFMRDRTGESIEENREQIRPLLLIQNNLGVDEDTAYRFHLEMWIYVHGIATMVATAYLPWDMDFISRSMTDMYQGLCSRFREGA